MSPTIPCDLDTLSSFVKLGASFFAVKMELDPETGKYSKRPTIPEWQKKTQFPINRDILLRESGASAFGFHPETIGAVVIDLDQKGDKDGEAELLKALGPCSQVTDPSVYCDTPNGRHLYFSNKGLDPNLLCSKNGILSGVDYRGHHSGGWLIAPGSVGWSDKRQEWTLYAPQGDFSSLPEMPKPLQDFLLSILDKKSNEQPEWIGAATTSEILSAPEEDPSLKKLFEVASTLEHVPSFFETLISAFVPEAVLSGRDYVTGDYQGKKGSSCKWSPSTGIIKDFAEAGKGGDFLWWLSTYRGMSNIDAARTILSTLGIPDPSRGSTLAAVKAEASVAVNASSAPATGEWPLTDSGNAERFVHEAEGNLLYNVSSAHWLVYDGMRWKPDIAAHTPVMLAKSVARSIAESVIGQTPKDKEDEKRILATLAWAKKSESADKRKAMVQMAQAEPEVTIMEEDLDLNPDLFNCRSGTIDLKTGTLHPHSKTDHITYLSDISYTQADCPYFKIFMNEIFEFDPELVEWMQVYLGYCLTGHVSLQIFPIWWGGGQNGKSVLLEILSGVMGNYHKKASADTWLQAHNNQSVRDDLASLRGARFVWSSEPDKHRSLSMSTIKEISGGDPITCRHLYGRLFTYRPQFKTAFVTNHKPRVESQDFGTWRRIKFVPFLWRVPEDRKVPDFGRLLLEKEASGILNWLVEGAVKWYGNGRKLPPCGKIDVSTKDLREGDDPLADFLIESCMFHSTLKVPFNQLWDSYRAWNDKRGVKLYMGRTTFKNNLGERAGISMRKAGTAYVVDGIGVRAELVEDGKYPTPPLYGGGDTLQ